MMPCFNKINVIQYDLAKSFIGTSINKGVLYYYKRRTLVMSGFKSCKNLARWFKTCKSLARILQDINQGKKINRGTNILGNIFEANYCLLNKLQNRIQWKKKLARIQKLARILQVFEFWKIYLCVWLGEMRQSILKMVVIIRMPV